MDNVLYTILVGGLGNQLFMIFNLISLSEKYNINFRICYDKNYVKDYYEKRKTLRTSALEYNLLSKLNFNEINHNNFSIFREKEFRYNQVDIPSVDNSYLLSGYFQSYKYFWEYREKIKEYLYIDTKIINEIRDKYKSFNKKILSIHVRLGDYVNLQHVHPIPSLEYYQKALKNYNLGEYQLILFSDNIQMAKEKLSPLNLKFIDADDFNTNDEYQLFMLSLTDVIICANSSFSLMSCYFNEMFNFNGNSQYILPSRWFGECGPKYNIDDFKLNDKFNFI